MRRIASRSLVIMFSVALAGCANFNFAVPLDRQIGGAPALVQSNGLIALVITAELQAAKWIYKNCAGGDDNCGVPIPLGDPIVHYSKQMLAGFYRELRVTPSIEKVDEAKLFITPTLRHFERGIPVSTNLPKFFSMGIEWRVTDPSGKILLLDTVIGEGSGTGAAYGEYINPVLGKLFQDVFTKSRARLVPVLTQSK